VQTAKFHNVDHIYWESPYFGYLDYFWNVMPKSHKEQSHLHIPNYLSYFRP
jgi:hypothetical protein